MLPRSYCGFPLTPRQLTTRRKELELQESIQYRPTRGTVIGADDILNLKITLETCKSADEFIERM